MLDERYTPLIRLAKQASKANLPIKEATQMMRAIMIQLALEAHEGNRSKAAEALGLLRPTLNAEIKRLMDQGILAEEQQEFCTIYDHY